LNSFDGFFLVPSNSFPLFHSFAPTDLLSHPPLPPDSKIEIIYESKLKKEQLLYVAKLKLGSISNKRVIVKFAHSYNAEAHRICESMNCAPKLYFVGQVSFPFFFF
jgi:hypothetical protein